MSKTSRIVFLVLLASILGACESSGPRQSTAVNRVLMAPQISTAPFSNVLIVGAAPTRETARNIEEGLTQELSRRNVESHSFVRESDAKEPSEEAIMALVDDKNIDAVLVVSAMLEGAELTSRSEQGDANVQSQVRGGGLVDFFRYDYKEVTRASYSDYTVNVVLVSDLYEVATKDRVYSVESSTAHGQTSYEIIIAEARAIVDRMKQDRLLR